MDLKWVRVLTGAIFVLVPGFTLTENLKKHPILSVLAVCLALFLLFQTVQSLMVSNDSQLNEVQNRLNQLVKEMEQERYELSNNDVFGFPKPDLQNIPQKSSESKTSVTENNDWMKKPEIVEIRNIYQIIEKLAGEKRFVIKDKSSICNDGSTLVEAKIYIDDRSRARKYTITAGSEDSVRESSYYYDNDQTLRFTFSSTKTAHNHHYESRIYFAADGKKILENERFLRVGFGGVGPVRNVFNPQKDFNNLC